MHPEYLFVPGHGVYLAEEAREVMHADDNPNLEPRPAELVVMRDGARGHYLTPTFLEDAADLLEGVDDPDLQEIIDEFREAAAAYGIAEDDAREEYDDLCNFADNQLFRFGYHVEFDDGYAIFKIHPSDT